MVSLPKIDMSEVTRLTKAGRLAEAMAVLRGTPSETSAEDGPIDLVAPTHAGGVWGVPPAAEPHSPNPIREVLAKVAAPLGGAILGRLGDQTGAQVLRDKLGRLQRSGDSILPSGSRFEERGFSSAAGTRTYKVFVPSRYAGEPLPLVVMLHGCTQSPDDFAAGTRMNLLAEEEMFLVAYPAQSQAANSSRCWNWFNAGDQRRDGGEPALIAGITRAVMSEFNVDAACVYVAGLSAGGATAAIMGATYPDLYAAVGVHSGLACGAAKDMQSAFKAMRQGNAATEPSRSSHRVPTIVFHGDGDHTVHPVNGDQVIAQSKADGSFTPSVSRGQADSGQAYTRTVQSDATGRPILEQWVLHGAGHAWSGGSSSGSYTDPRGPDASRAMIDFFRQHRRQD